MKDRYVKILQNFLSQCIDIKYQILKIIHGFRYILRIKLQIKNIFDCNG